MINVVDIPEWMDKPPRILSSDLFALFMVWDAALLAPTTATELAAARSLWLDYDKPDARQQIIANLIQLGRDRLARTPIGSDDERELRRVFSQLPFGPADEAGRQIIFILWLWSRFDRERAVTLISLEALQHSLLAQVQRMVDLPAPLAKQSARAASEMLALERVISGFCPFLRRSEYPPAWGLTLASHVAAGALGAAATAIAPAELVAAIWCAYRLDTRSFVDVRDAVNASASASANASST